ncbi:hypothetical protein D9M71_162300 [compost metagenome]
MVTGDLASSYSGVDNTSENRTICRSSLGISMPTVVLPGITSTTRTLITASERARSLARLVIRLTLMPAAGWISKRVITGPGWAATTCTSTPNSLSLISSRRDMDSSDSGEKLLGLFWAGSSSDSGGSVPATASST